MDVKDGKTIYAKNANDIGATAAAKMLTCIIAIENGDINAKYNFASAQDKHTTMQVTLGDLLYGMMLESRNDFAELIAMCISGSVAEFVNRMKATARKLYMNNSRFVTPTGLQGHSTARDTALLACYALENPIFRKIISTPEYTFTMPQKTLVFKNTTALIHRNGTQADSMYPYCEGGKTALLNGKHSLVSIAHKDEQRHVLVQLGVSSFDECFSNAIIMHDWVFSTTSISQSVSKDSLDMKKQVIDASQSFATKKMGRPGENRLYTTNPDVAYCSFYTPNFTIRPEEAQRNSAKRFARFGIEEDSLKNKTLLDLGCNIGAMLFQASNMGISAGLGLEYDGDKVEISKNIAAMSNLEMLTFRQGDLDILTANDIGEFDVVFSLAVEGHVRDRDRFFNLLGAITKQTLYFEGNLTCPVEDAKAKLKSAGFGDIVFIGYSDDDINNSYNRRPMFKATKAT